MTPERYRQIVELCQAVWELVPEHRAEFLTKAVNCDESLRCEVESMLAADQQSAAFLSDTPDDLAASAFSSIQPQLPIGASFGGYKIIACLGFGGMGQVFLAQDLRLGRKVVIKLLPEEFSRAPLWLHRFKEEASAVSALNHPNILTVYGFGRTGSIHFLATEYVDGCTLREMISGGSLGLPKAIGIAIQITSALVEAHSGGIVHRDIKPENIMVRHDGLVKVLDFGISKRTASLSNGPQNGQAVFDTSPGILVGTPRYMSPEQARGLPFDSRTDLFSLGSVLYEMVAGRPAFDGSTASDTLAAVLTHEPAPLTGLRAQLPASFVNIVDRALKKDVNHRYQSAAEMLADLVEVRQSLERDHLALSSGSGRRIRMSVLAVCGTLLVLFVSLLAIRLFHSRDAARGFEHAGRIHSLAVLPIDDLSHVSDQSYFSDGMTEQLITDLSKIRTLRVISRYSVMQYKKSRKPLAQIARELNVDAILVGSVLFSGGRLRITAQLVQAKPQQNLWAESYDRGLQDWLPLQAEVARSIAAQIRSTLTPEEQKQLKGATPVDAEAQDLYFKGQYHANKGDEQNLLTAISYFQKAVTRSPRYAQPYCGLAFAYTQLGGLNFHYFPPREAMPKAKAAALKALEIDDTLSEAHTWLGLVKLSFDWDWAGAEHELKRAIELNPSSADAHLLYEGYLVTRERVDDALLQTNLAHQLDPLSLRFLTEAQFIHIIARRYDEAIALGHHSIDMEPASAPAYANNGLAFAQKGDFRNAFKDLNTALRLEDRPVNRLFLAHVQALAGDRSGAKRQLAQVKAMSTGRYLCPYEVATAYASLDENNEAFRWLQKALSDRVDCMLWLGSEPWMDKLRQDARYRELLDQVGLPNHVSAR
jgi:eukaryotic-like serine/threonine-protein kinase